MTSAMMSVHGWHGCKDVSIKQQPNLRIEPMRRSAFRLVQHAGAVDALLLMAHPKRSARIVL
jgi:hypothetical protein